MKRILAMALLALAISCLPAMADAPFHAFRQMSIENQSRLTPLSDTQLASWEGQACLFCRQRLDVFRLNVAEMSLSFLQQNLVSVSQTMN